MTNFTVGPSPLQIIGSGVDNSPLTVQNTGAVSIYISGDPGVSTVAFEYKIDAGGDFIWPPGKPLSVCTGPGVIGQISYGGTGDVHVNSGSTNVTGAVTINGSVPIAGPVTVTGTVALSGGSVNLAGPIAITGGVSVTGSTINVGNAVALANIPVLVYSTNLAIGSGANTYMTLYSTSTIITSYSSLLVQIITTSTSAGIFLPVATNYISMTISCTGTASSGGSNSVYNPQWMYVTQGNGPPNTPFIQSLQIPVTNTNMAIQTNVTVSAGFAGNVNIKVYGTGQVINTPIYRSDGDGFVGTIPEGGLYNSGSVTGNSGPFFMSSLNKAAFVSFYNQNTTTNGFIELQYAQNGVITPFSGIVVTGSTPGSGPIAQLQFPMLPIVITTAKQPEVHIMQLSSNRTGQPK